MKQDQYRRTQLACYLGFVTQAITANFAPLLFLTFHQSYHISFGQLALISTCFFFTQLVVDFICGTVVDRLGYRPCIIAAEVTSGLGLAGLASLPILGLIGCAVCGFSVGIMWPGSISISSRILPAGGTAMFALLALAGDLGGALGPAIIGNVSQNAGNNLQAGVLAGVGFPIILVLCVFLIRKQYKESRAE